jgi:hypothetical protein
LLIRFIVSHKPLKNPYFVKASIEYWEQVGTNLQDGGNNGEIKS